MSEPTVVAAFQRLQAGDAAGALEIASAVSAAQPGNVRAALAAGIALRGLGRLDEARLVLERAAALDAKDYAVAYELGLLHDLRGDSAAALAQFERAAGLRPGFAPAQYGAAAQHLARQEWGGALQRFETLVRLDPRDAEAHAGRARALEGAGRRAEAERAWRMVLGADAGHAVALRTLGRYGVARGDFASAAAYFTTAVARAPDDAALPIFLAQAELLLGHWKAGWNAYQRRDTRLAFEQERAREGRPYRVPGSAEVAGRSVRVVAEQGLGDILFFLRFVPQLTAARVTFAGDARLHSLLERTGLFASLVGDRRASSQPCDFELLSGDLPLVCADGDPTPPSLRVTPDAIRAQRWRQELERLGPRPWTGITWRAGAPGAEKTLGLHKTVPIEPLLAALQPAGGTLFAIQRLPAVEEMAQAQLQLGAPLADLSAMNDDLESALALLSVLDRHVGVSNTNMHLAALAGKTAEVLVPFPPEWRWGAAGASPWNPGFEVLRQGVDGDWQPALERLVIPAQAGIQPGPPPARG